MRIPFGQIRQIKQLSSVKNDTRGAFRRALRKFKIHNEPQECGSSLYKVDSIKLALDPISDARFLELFDMYCIPPERLKQGKVENPFIGVNRTDGIQGLNLECRVPVEFVNY